MSRRRRWAHLAVVGALATSGATPHVHAQDGVGFRASVGPDTVFVGQQASYTLIVTVPADVRQRLRRNPVFIPPEARAMLAYDLPMAKTDPAREGAETHIFRRALFPLTAGRYPIAAAQLSYALPQSPSFFSREEERVLRSEPMVVVAIEPPLAGRPAGWSGAVGRWTASARVDATTARVGDPFVLTLRVTGVGNATLLPRPVLAVPGANVVAEDERVVLDSTPTALAGAKEFAWLVTPRAAGTLQLPGLEYPYFDPDARGYAVARAAPITLRVRAGDLVTIPERPAISASAALLRLRPQLAGARPLASDVAAWWSWLVLAAPLPWIFVSWRRRRPRKVRVRTPVERLADPQIARPGPLRSLYADALLARTGVRVESATGRGALAARLRREGVTGETASDAEGLRDALDADAFSPAPRPPDRRERVRALLARVDAEARRPVVLMLLAILLVATACTAVPSRDETTLIAFTEGQTAYAGRDFLRARDAFFRSARAAPRDAAAWANFGTAGWHASDTASAVLGWQRALRLDPLATDLRPRLARVRAPQSRGVAAVWAFPPLVAATAGLLLWIVAWVLLASRARGRRPGASIVLVLPGVALLLLAAVQETRLRARDLVVIASATPLRALPALGSDPGAVPLVGEVVRVKERRGVWLRLELEAGRAGWYPAERTYSLQRD